jgi:Vam6/Vps39-like protein vacuolar protein sorting-associated protein 39
VRFLTDRRPKLFKALETIKITPENQTEQYPPLSKTPVEDLFALPDAPLSALTPEQLLRFAQIIDTALYKAYLIIRPTLLSSLCRVANWCEVSELEEDLYKRKVWLSFCALDWL